MNHRQFFLQKKLVIHLSVLFFHYWKSILWFIWSINYLLKRSMKQSSNCAIFRTWLIRINEELYILISIKRLSNPWKICLFNQMSHSTTDTTSTKLTNNEYLLLSMSVGSIHLDSIILSILERQLIMSTYSMDFWITLWGNRINLKTPSIHTTAKYVFTDIKSKIDSFYPAFYQSGTT